VRVTLSARIVAALAGLTACACSSGRSLTSSPSHDTQATAELRFGGHDGTRAMRGPSPIDLAGVAGAGALGAADTAVPVESLPRAGAVDLSPATGGRERCFLKTPGVFGTCMPAASCAALGAHVSAPGHCSGASGVECCTPEPRLDGAPPAGWIAVPQSRVTTDMTAWALRIVGAPSTYPMGSSITQLFGTRQVLARVEWHPPDAGHGVIHRGVTLYEPESS
jgi:hypothetical protein